RCGMAGEPGHVCRRGPRCVSDYQARLSGPFLDRIDIRIDVPAVSAADMFARAPSEPSETVARRVAQARLVQSERYAAAGLSVETNAAVTNSQIEAAARIDAKAVSLLRDAAEAMRFSARAYHRIIKVARTIADLEGADGIARIHVAEAISYRVVSDRVAQAA
ncbi:MAG: ATP-binding protein, partial [Nitratireductor sp.]|nr:ATP-binding protein [Nitratireductor sp.]